jgi:hypothetical protein
LDDTGRDALTLPGVGDLGWNYAVEAALLVGDGGNGALVVLAISLKPSGISMTWSPWLIHTSSMP